MWKLYQTINRKIKSAIKAYYPYTLQSTGWVQKWLMRSRFEKKEVELRNLKPGKAGIIKLCRTLFRILSVEIGFSVTINITLLFAFRIQFNITLYRATIHPDTNFLICFEACKRDLSGFFRYERIQWQSHQIRKNW